MTDTSLARLVICDECYAAVLAEAEALHTEWHQLMASTLLRAVAMSRPVQS